jgi:hypothetical protein
MVTGPSTYPREGVIHPNNLQGLFKPLCSNERDVSLCSLLQRTSCLTVRYTPFLDKKSSRKSLREGTINGPAKGEITFKVVGDVHRTDLGTLPTSCAIFKAHITGLFLDSHGEISRFSFHRENLGHGKDLNVEVATTLYEFRRENAHGTVIGGEGLVETGHKPSKRRGLLDKIDVKTRFSKVKG